AALWLATPSLMYRNIRRHAVARKRPCIHGRHVLEADSTGLRAKCDISESLHAWAGVKSIEPKGKHVFVFIGDSLGYTVPRARILSGDLDRFVELASGYARGDA